MTHGQMALAAFLIVWSVFFLYNGIVFAYPEVGHWVDRRFARRRRRNLADRLDTPETLLRDLRTAREDLAHYVHGGHCATPAKPGYRHPTLNNPPHVGRYDAKMYSRGYRGCGTPPEGGIPGPPDDFKRRTAKRMTKP